MTDIIISFDAEDGWDNYSVLKDIVDQANTNINALDASVYVSIFDTSLGNLSSWNVTQDASKAVIDTSLGNLSHWNVTQDASKAVIDTSLGNLSHWNVTQDASIVLKANRTYVDTSLGAYMHIYPGLLAGLKDASGVNGDVLFDTSTLYFKLGGVWIRTSDVSIISFG